MGPIGPMGSRPGALTGFISGPWNSQPHWHAPWFLLLISHMRNGALLSSTALCILLAACATKDREHYVVVSIADQAMDVYRNNLHVARYPVSTSKFGPGDRPGSCHTPLGELEIARKIGDGAPMGAVFRDRRPTGEVLKPDAPGRDPIVTRILWLRGLQHENQNAFGRCIYIHGTAEERNIGRPASYGCIRMRSHDVLHLFRTVGVGARVDVVYGPLPDPDKLTQNTSATAALASGG
jgi:hypothetical protein